MTTSNLVSSAIESALNDAVYYRDSFHVTVNHSIVAEIKWVRGTTCTIEVWATPLAAEVEQAWLESQVSDNERLRRIDSRHEELDASIEAMYA